MIRKKCGHGAGFTIVETLMAAGLLSTVVAVLAFVIHRSIVTQEFERATRTAQQLTRTALDRMVDEMRLACPVSTYYNGDVTPSGIIYPDSYKSQGGSAHSSATNKLVFIRPKASRDSSDLGDMGSFVVVTWSVPSTKDVVHRFVSSYAPGVLSNKAVTYSASGGSGNSAFYYVDPNSLIPGTIDENQAVVVSFTGHDGRTKTGAFNRAKAQTTFTVSHKVADKVAGYTPSADYNDPIYYTYYDRKVFKVTFTTKVENKAKKGDPFEAKFESQVRLQS